MRLKIGEFARLGQVSVSALRYYDEVGLLRPTQARDQGSGIRDQGLPARLIPDPCEAPDP